MQKLVSGDFTKAALFTGCSIPAIRAVASEEGGSTGFYPNGHVILKFEGHIFHHFTQGKYDQSHPTLSYPAWTERYSEYGEAAYRRFNAACLLDPKAAMLATSWGMFQIMGENYSSCGYKSVGDFVDAMHQSEWAQLSAFCTYLKTQGLAHYLINMALPGQALIQAAGFALRYNGTGFKKNHYDVNIADYFTQYSKQAA